MMSYTARVNYPGILVGVMLHLMCVAGMDASFVRYGLEVNGRRWEKPWIRFDDIAHGGTLAYDLGSSPDAAWGGCPGECTPVV